MNAFFVAKTAAYRKDLNNRYNPDSIYTGDPCIYGVFDANTNKYKTILHITKDLLYFSVWITIHLPSRIHCRP